MRSRNPLWLVAFCFAVGAVSPGAEQTRPLQTQEELPVPDSPYRRLGDGRPDVTEKLEEQEVEALAKPQARDASNVSEGSVDRPPDTQLSIFFKTLSAESIRVTEVVERLAKYHAERGVVRVHIIGNTDSDRIRGKALKLFKDNHELSKARARLVANALAHEGVTAYPLTYEGKGPDNPVAPNDTPANKQKNRRTEVYVYFRPPDVAPSAPVVTKRQVATLLSRLQCLKATKGTKEPAAPFRVTVDGDTQDDKQQGGNVDFQRCTDVALEHADVQVHFDGLRARKALNFSLSPDIAAPGAPVSFRAHGNYWDFVERAEVRIFLRGQSTRTAPVDLVPLEKRDGTFLDAVWRARNTAALGYTAVLRVYDANGSFDETEPKNLELREGTPIAGGSLDGGYGENRLATSNIRVEGGTLLVNGEKIPPTHTVKVFGRTVPKTKDGKFVVEQIFRSGVTYGVDVSLLDGDGKGLEFRRDLHVPEEDWFYVGIADLLFGGHRSKGPANLVSTGLDHYDKSVFVDGRVAFYLKGKIQGKWLLTASADTREGPLSQIFSNFLDKDPQSLFRRLDPDKFYPVYGDDSTLVEDAPTQGRFYVKLERDASHVLWGNFRTTLTETELAQVDRGLYGFQLKWQSSAQQGQGERKTKVEIFAASPGTVAAREEFRGTGGSFFWLRGRDIAAGSERVRVEVRDRNTGVVLKMTPLRPAEDYSMNYLQGHVLLKSPLPAMADDSELVHAGTLSGHAVFLVVRYEFTPGLTSPSSIAVGGRASHWFGDRVQLGVTAARQDQPGADQQLYGADGTVRIGDRSYIKGEVAQTYGPGPEEYYSIDGGYSFDLSPQLRTANVRANAFRTEALFGLYSTGGRAGALSLLQRRREAGFSAPGEVTLRDLDQWTAKLDLPLSGAFGASLRHDRRLERGWVDQSNVSLDFDYSTGNGVFAGLGARNDERWDNSGGLAATTLAVDFGKRVDVAAKLGWRAGDRYEIYGVAQGTARREGGRLANDRLGGGGKVRVADRLKIGGEVTGGAQGLGARGESVYQWDDKTDVYVGYLMESTPLDSGFRSRTGGAGSLVSGVRGRYSDSTSVHYESKYLHGTQPTGLTHSFGVDLAPLEHWTFGFTGERGDVFSTDLSKSLKRTAASFSVGFDNRRTKAGTVLEYRHEESGSAVRDTYLTRNQFLTKATDSLRILGKVNLSRSRNTQGAFYDGDWTEAVVGLAYRPIENDRWNGLFKYGYYDLTPSPGQRDPNGAAVDLRQRTHVLSLDVVYDVWSFFSLGAKGAVAVQQLQNDRLGGPWFQSNRLLAILRGDFRIGGGWEGIVEGRALWTVQAKNSRSGALLGLYKALAADDALKIGVGYNFTDFSDDLTDMSFNSHGWFLNLVGAL